MVAIDQSGGATLSAPGMPAVGIAVPGASNTDAVVSDGAFVNSDALPSTDVVTRATEAGGQFVAVLQSAAAPDSIPFALDLPTGSQLVPRSDGSIEVKAPVESEVVPQAELDRVASQVEAALVDTSSDIPLTDGERTAVAAVAPAQTQAVTEVQTIATVAPAWAVDANGTNLETHFEVHGHAIIQVVKTDTNTAYPVTADPSWLWWAWTSAQCVADIGAIVLGGAYLVSKAVTKVQSYIASSRRISSLVSRLGGTKSMLQTVYNAGRGIVRGRVGKYLSDGQVTALSGLVAGGLSLISDILGIGSCYSLLREAL